MDTDLRDPVERVVERFQQRRIGRREALRLLAAVTGSAGVASSILAACSPSPQPAAPAGPAAAAPPPEPPPAPAAPTPSPVPASAANVQFPGEGATLLGYLARPAGAGPFPAVLICHENRGLLDHFKDVARRLAGEGYVALAVDLVSREGGTEGATPDQVRSALARSLLDRHVGDFQSGLRYLQSQPFVRGDRIGMTGFCFGGAVTWLVAARTAELRAAVPFYGSNPPLEEVPNLRAAVLGLYGEQDRSINPGIPAIEAAMAQNGKTYEKEIYPNAGHAFFNDTGQAYNAEAARTAWARTVGWFDRYLRA